MKSNFILLLTNGNTAVLLLVFEDPSEIIISFPSLPLKTVAVFPSDRLCSKIKFPSSDVDKEYDFN